MVAAAHVCKSAEQVWRRVQAEVGQDAQKSPQGMTRVKRQHRSPLSDRRIWAIAVLCGLA